MATGLGKTIVSAFIAKDELEKGYRGLFLCHENDILEQALKEYRLVLGESAILKTFYGNSKDWRADNADVLFASFQSFSKWHQAFDEIHFDFIIVDESHHGQAPTYKEVIEYFKPKKLLGMTATPNRGDEQDIREIFGEEIVNYSLEESIVNGWLANVEYRILHDGISTKKLKQIMHSVLEEGERISVKQLNENIFIKMRDEEIAKIILSYNAHKTIIFCENIDHVDNFAKHLPDSAVFHSKLSSKHNQKILKEFKEGKQHFILSVNKFNEGIDVPEAEMIVFLRCTDSETIFRQQLGRGLRKALNKEKVIVLDFVANVNRLLFLNEMAGKINKFAKKSDINFSKRKFFVEGKSYSLIFDSQLVDLLEVLNRLNVEFYPTWQEASKAAIGLGCKTLRKYWEAYKEDSRLPSMPHVYYSDFPGWIVFLGGEKKEFYPTWQEASKAAIALNIKSGPDYRKRYSIDASLHSNPHVYYSDFPGWVIFLGGEKKEFYPTWQEASKAAIDLNIKSGVEYLKKYKKDSKLPSDPINFYSNFPGFVVFLGGQKKDLYPTWQEASKAAISLGMKFAGDYRPNNYKDERLPGNPAEYYSDFPGYTIFLGRNKKNPYPTWQEASRAAIGLGISSQADYWKKYKKDQKLPGNPGKFYPDFPGWLVYLGKKTKTGM
jgi:superfamily II DNA or RNA helicase